MPSQALWGEPERVYARISTNGVGGLTLSYPYVSMDGVWHKRPWNGVVENVSVLVAIGVAPVGPRTRLKAIFAMESHEAAPA